MPKTILLTGATDGIGLATVKQLLNYGHRVLLHGRSQTKLAQLKTELQQQFNLTELETYCADLSNLSDINKLIDAIIEQHKTLDILINNAGVFKTPQPITADKLDIRFVVNTLAPYKLTQGLMPILHQHSRVINLSSAAQAPVDLAALIGQRTLSDMEAYAQSKQAITIWSHALAQQLSETGPIIIAVNPGSLLASKMVTQGFGVAGNDISIGADIICRLALADEFANATGQYFDNDSGQFGTLPAQALDKQASQQLISTIETILTSLD